MVTLRISLSVTSHLIFVPCFYVVVGLHRAVSGVLPPAFACPATSGTEAAAAGTLPADVARGRSPAARGPAHRQAQPHRSLPYQVSQAPCHH